MGHSSEQFKNLCTFSDSIFSILPLHNINILASFFFTSYTLPEIKCKNSSFSNLCLQIIFWSHFFQFNLSTNTTSATFCNFWLNSQLVEILNPIILTKNSCYYVLFNFLGGKIQIFGHFLSKNPIFSALTFHKYYICNFMKLLSPHPVSGHIKYWNISKNSLLLCTVSFFGQNLDFWSFNDPKSQYYQLWPFTNTTSATFCNFSLHNLLVDILSPKMQAKIPCYYVL